MQLDFAFADPQIESLTVKLRRSRHRNEIGISGSTAVNSLADITPDGALFGGINGMPIISATALKGGVSKTTLVHFLAGAYSLAAKRVLLIDNDPQASLSCGIFTAAVSEQIPPAATVAAIYAGLDPLPDQVIRPTNLAGVDVIPGSMAAAEFNTPNPYNAPAHAQTYLRDFLAEVRDRYDVVMIDNPPTLSAATWAALVAADYALCPLIPEDYGTSSLSPVLASIDLVKMGANPSLHLLGLVLTMVQPRLGVHIAFEGVLRESHGDLVFASRFPMASDVKESIAFQRPVTHHKPRGASAKAVKAIADEVVRRIADHQALVLEVATSEQG